MIQPTNELSIKTNTHPHMNYTHDDIFNMLVLGDFPRNYARATYDLVGQQNTIYFEAMDRVRESNTDKDIEKDYFEHDAIISFFPERARETSYHISNVAIEIKTNKGNLQEDEKMTQYIGPADAFFLAVPSPLLKHAIRKILCYKSLANRIGVIEALSGDIVIMPQRNDRWVDIERRDRILGHIYMMKKRVETPKPEHKIMATRLGLDRPRFVDYKGLQVNNNYLDYVQSIY